MGARSSGREAALQMLFGLDATASDMESAIGDFWREHPGDPEGRQYAEALVRGVMGDLKRLDAAITAASENWRIERMTRVDRNTLRIGVWELLERDDVPCEVILDEAVVLAKSYGTGDSGAFVNGVLARAARDAGRAVNPGGAEPREG